MTDALTIIDLQKSYGDQPAIAGVSFTLQRGEFMALLGPSGCGKTTTLRLIAGLERPDAGRVHIQGRLVAGPGAYVPPDQRRVGLVFQDYALFPHLTVARNVAYGLPRRADKASRVAEMLALVGLAGVEARLPHQLSGGQQQRVALARALAPQPDLLLLDEPFSNLDSSLRSRVREDVRRIIKATGVAAILVTHDQDEALSMADRVAVMLGGCIEQIGTPREVYECPTSVEAMHFLGEVNQLAGQAAGDVVETALGALLLENPQHGPVSVYIRPEHLTLAPDGPATVEQVRYFGSYQLVQVRLPGDERIRIRSDATAQHAPGDAVRVSVCGPVLCGV